MMGIQLREYVVVGAGLGAWYVVRGIWYLVLGGHLLTRQMGGSFWSPSLIDVGWGLFLVLVRGFLCGWSVGGVWCGVWYDVVWLLFLWGGTW